MKEEYLKPLGWWKVTTPDDCEGRTRKDLGVYEGYVDEIALFLADKAVYHLNFKKITDHTPRKTGKEKFSPDPNKRFPPSAKTVHVQYDIESETWNTVKTNEGIIKIKSSFIDRPVRIEFSNYYASFIIIHQDLLVKKTGEDIVNNFPKYDPSKRRELLVQLDTPYRGTHVIMSKDIGFYYVTSETNNSFGIQTNTRSIPNELQIKKKLDLILDLIKDIECLNK